MRKLILAISAFALVMPLAIPISAAGAQTQSTKAHRTARHHARTYRRARGCRHSSGTAGLIAGGVGGAVVGNEVIGHGLLGAAAGGVGGAFAGRAIDRSMTARRRGCR